MFRIKKRRRGPLPLKYVVLLSFIFFIAFTVQGLFLINKGIEPTLLSIAEARTRQIASEAINDALSKKIVDNMELKDLITIHEDTKGEAVGYSFNPQIYNRVVADTNIRVEQYLEYIEAGDLEKLEPFKNDIHVDYKRTKEQKGIVYFIPLGMATDNALLANLGPRVPVRFEILGNVISDIETKIKETGINNTYLEIYINVRVATDVIVPFSDKGTEISHSIKIGDLFLQGKVPQYYNGSGESGGDVSLPID